MVATILEYGYSVVTIALLWYTLFYSRQQHQYKKKVLRAWFLFGLIFGMFAFLLPYTAYPIPWLAPGATQMLGLFLFNFVVGLVCACAYSIVALSFFFYTKRWCSHWSVKAAFFATLLSVAEILRSLLLSLLFYGNGGWIGLHWTGETVGNSLSITPFIEYAYFGGSYMLTFIVGILVYTTHLLIHDKKRYIYGAPFLCLTLGLLLIHYFIPVRGPDTPVTVAVVSTTFTFPSKEDNTAMVYARRFVDLYTKTLALAPYAPDIIVYPEDAEFTRLLVRGRDLEIQKVFPDTLIIDGSTIKKGDRLSNVTVMYDTKTLENTFAYKRFMFPLNEYIPYIFMSLFHYFINPSLLATFAKDHGYTPVFSARSYVHDGIRVATLLCSEIVSFETVRAVGREHPDIIFHQAQLVLFGGSPVYAAHLRSFTKVAAAQLRTTTVGSINEMPSYIVSPYGEILDEVHNDTKNTVAISLYIISKNEIKIVNSE